MGHAMLSRWMRDNPQLDVSVIEPNTELRARAASTGAKSMPSINSLPANYTPEIIFLAVKPEMVGAVVEESAGLLGNATLVSIAAGIDTLSISDKLPEASAVIRCMPNLPSAIGEGCIGLYANSAASAATKDQVEQLLRSMGKTVWVDDEELLDVVTAVSGSGPAYVFYFLEALEQAAISLRMPEPLASTLALQTMYGAALYARSSGDTPKELRKRVTSKNGTTAAALGVLMADTGLFHLISEAAKAAHERSKEIRRDGVPSKPGKRDKITATELKL